MTNTAESGKPDAPRPGRLARGFATTADRAAHLIGQPHAFILLSIGIAAWAAAVYFLHIADGWRPVDGAIGVVTFLMVFLVQSTQNRHSAAIQAKLDELIRALETAENKFMGIEKLTIEEVHAARRERDPGGEDRGPRRAQAPPKGQGDLLTPNAFRDIRHERR